MAGGLRDGIANYTVDWLGDNLPESVSYGFRTLWAFGRFADLLLEVLFQASLAAVGKGTPTAHPYLAQARGIVQAQNETPKAFQARLQKWIERAKSLGTQYAIAREIHEYMASRPKVRVVSRNGSWTTIDTDGTVTTNETAPFTWDNVSHPERAGYWSEQWIIVYTTTQWTFAPNWGVGSWGGTHLGLGHLCTREEYDTIRRVVREAKAARSYIRGVIWTSDATKFNPTNSATWPDGSCGAWGTRGSGSRVASGRNLSTTRYWEF